MKISEICALNIETILKKYLRKLKCISWVLKILRDFDWKGPLDYQNFRSLIKQLVNQDTPATNRFNIL
jgi:hypothetical protein